MFLVVFRNRKRADIDQAAYDAEAERMEELARTQPGFLSFKSYSADDGEFVAISEWEDEASALAWRTASRSSSPCTRSSRCDLGSASSSAAATT